MVWWQFPCMRAGLPPAFSGVWPGSSFGYASNVCLDGTRPAGRGGAFLPRALWPRQRRVGRPRPTVRVALRSIDSGDETAALQSASGSDVCVSACGRSVPESSMLSNDIRSAVLFLLGILSLSRKCHMNANWAYGLDSTRQGIESYS